MSSESAGSNAAARELRGSRLRILFFVEGFTDIRFVIGLSEICDLTMVVPERQYLESGLKGRIESAGCRIDVVTVPGGRPAFQFRSLLCLWSLAPRFDVILAQEVLRGALNANLVGAFRRIPVVTYMGIAPLEYFRCRRERKQISLPAALLGEAAIRSLMSFNGFFATRCLAMGPYLAQVAGGYCSRASVGLYYGVDTVQFRPADSAERASLRERLDLPRGSFLVLLSSRISHEKDPETVLRAISIARSKGLDARLVNLGGGFRDFLKLARDLSLPEVERWTIGREAVNPLNEVSDYFRAADAMALASLAEGAAYSTLEALACGTPVVATAVGGMAVQLDGYARLVPRRDADAMAHELLWVAANRDAAHAQALKGRDHVLREWRREKAFADLLAVLRSASGLPQQSSLKSA
jgi:glycosyltransferase involved in cell wall biosynthesis